MVVVLRYIYILIVTLKIVANTTTCIKRRKYYIRQLTTTTQKINKKEKGVNHESIDKTCESVTLVR